MIHPSELQLESLPWVPLKATSGFPEDPAVYFAIDAQGAVQYVGRSINVRGRWDRHHRYKDLEKIGGVKIAYLYIEDISLLTSIETALVDWFDPPLNAVRTRKTVNDSSGETVPMKVRKVVDLEVPGLGDRIRQARESDSRSLAEICRQIPMSPMNWYKLEKEETKALPVETLRRIEQVLGVDFGVSFEASSPEVKEGK